MQVNITAQTQDGHTMKQLADLIATRSSWLGETTIDSVSACALQLLISLRSLTRVANPKKTKIEVTELPGLKLSFTTTGSKKIPCLRIGNSRYFPPSNTRIMYKSIDKNARPFEFKYSSPKGKIIVYIIVASSSGDAKREAKIIVTKRAYMYKGLAKRALGQLMYKACSLNPTDQVNSKTNWTADANSLVAHTLSHSTYGAMYNLDMFDELLYATAALKNGKSDIELAAQKSMNKVVSAINKKCKNLLGFQKLSTPFPELVKRRAK